MDLNWKLNETSNFQSNDGDNLLPPETIAGRADDSNQINVSNTKTVAVLDDVFSEMDNIEETAAKVLYGLQNMDRTESPQLLSIAQPTKEMDVEFLNYTNFAGDRKTTVSVTFCCWLKLIDVI